MAEENKTQKADQKKVTAKKPTEANTTAEKTVKTPTKQVKTEKSETVKLETVKKPVVAEAKTAVKQAKPSKAEAAKPTEKAPSTVKKAKPSKKGTPGVFIATGRRKKSVARVRLIAGGSGKITVNKRDIDDYLLLDTLKLVVRQPLKLTDTEKSYDVIVNVFGGGYTGQTGAIRHGIARALVKENETFKAELKKAGFLSRDSRMKERKKYGLKKARKAPQFSKR